MSDKKCEPVSLVRQKSGTCIKWSTHQLRLDKLYNASSLDLNCISRYQLMVHTTNMYEYKAGLAFAFEQLPKIIPKTISYYYFGTW